MLSAVWCASRCNVFSVSVFSSDRDKQVMQPPRPRRHPDAAAQRTLNVLVVGTDDWAIEQSSASLRAAGHEVSRCQDPGAPAFPCRALQPGGTCPLDAGVELVVTSRARPAATPTAHEMGVICGLHNAIPLVVTGISRNGPFTPWATTVVPADGDLAAACLEAADKPAPVIHLDEELA
jgi:hypothetical protein